MSISDIANLRSACISGDLDTMRQTGDALSGIHSLLHRKDLSYVERESLMACLDLACQALHERVEFLEESENRWNAYLLAGGEK